MVRLGKSWRNLAKHLMAAGSETGLPLEKKGKKHWLKQAENEGSANPALHDKGMQRFGSPVRVGRVQTCLHEVHCRSLHRVWAYTYLSIHLLKGLGAVFSFFLVSWNYSYIWKKDTPELQFLDCWEFMTALLILFKCVNGYIWLAQVFCLHC